MALMVRRLCAGVISARYRFMSVCISTVQVAGHPRQDPKGSPIRMQIRLNSDIPQRERNQPLYKERRSERAPSSPAGV